MSDPTKSKGYKDLTDIIARSKDLKYAILVADSRERALFPYMNIQSVETKTDNELENETNSELENETDSELENDDKIPTFVVQLTVGDFAIIYKGRVLAIVERKSWQDMASSIRDGRSKNVKKLRKARTALGARIYYLLEGRRPARDALVGKVPMKAITSHLRHLQGHTDGVGMLFSRKLEDTVLELEELAGSMLTLKKPTAVTGGNPAVVLMTAMEKTPDHISMLRAIRGIAEHSAVALYDMGITLPALHRALYKVPESTIPEIWQKVLNARHPDGKRVIAQHKVVRGAIAGLSNGGKKMPVRILQNTYGISTASAKKFIEVLKLGDVMRDVTLLDTTKLPITKKATENLRKLFS